MLARKYIPNALTYSRIVVIPIFVAVFYWHNPLAAWINTGIFLYASITDFLDGYFARAWKVTSNIGRVLDPIADKLLVSTALLMLVKYQNVDVLPAIAIVCREVLVSGLREFLAELRIGMPVSRLAKFKTAAQLIAISLLLLASAVPPWLHAQLLGEILLWVAAALTLITGYVYLKTGMQHLSIDTMSQ